MNKGQFQEKDYWRGLILFGGHTATYKLALAKALYNFSQKHQTQISMMELAKEFFDIYSERLKNGKPQLVTPGRRTRVENIINEYNTNLISGEEAINKIEKNAFNDVVPRFHNIFRNSTPIKFYEKEGDFLILQDSLFNTFDNPNENQKLIEEIDFRWDLLEAAFEIRRENWDLINDIRLFYLAKGYERTNITKTIPVLDSYQNGICFYCGEELQGVKHVDHVIPRQFIYHDEIWNLVLTHEFCNIQKGDALPDKKYIGKLIARNEYFIASDHPVKQNIIKELGKNRVQRERKTYKIYDDARFVIGYTWEGIKGYKPESDEFFKGFMRLYSSGF